MKYDKNNFIHLIVIRFVDFITRWKSPPQIIFKSGIGVILASLAMPISWNFVAEFLELELTLGDDSLPTYGIIIGFFITLVGIILYCREYLISQSKNKIIVFEQRGLKFAPDTLLKSICKNRIGKLAEINCDIRQRMDNGIIHQPEEALKRIINATIELESKCNNVSSENLSITYGGLMAIPFTFLTGMLVDDESNMIDVADWDRDKKTWRMLDEIDDSERFEITGLENMTSKKEVILAISASYTVDFESIEKTLGSLPLVHMKLPNGGHNCHWSKEKQEALCRSFSDTLFKLKSLGTRKLHLFIAAPNSLCFNLGRQYDSRNFPDAQVYQYEYSKNPPFPWAVELPTHGKEPSIIHMPKS